MRTVTVLAAAALTAIAACAKQPEDIAAVDVGPNAYAGYSCNQLATEQVRLNQTLENLSAQQRDAASGDAMGVFLIGLPLSSMSGGDRETQIAVTRGQIQAVERKRLESRCSG